MDVVRPRLYNQPVAAPGASGGSGVRGGRGGGTLYRGAVHAFGRILSCEGPLAFYKGAFTHWLRLGPQVTLVFVFLEQFKSFAAAHDLL